ncbi:MAG TPA: hypothetical protein VGD22_18250, partial [Sphingobacteriaceae bacterium]
PITQKLKEYSMPATLLTGIFIVVLYFVFKYLIKDIFNAHINGFKELFGIGLTILGSGIFFAVLKWFQFMDFFKNELEAVINSGEFDRKLENAVSKSFYEDAYIQRLEESGKIQLWKRVTHAVFKSELPANILESVDQKLSGLLFHNSKISHFYAHYFITLMVNLDEDGFLTIEERSEVKIIRPSTDPFKLDIDYNIIKSGADDNVSKIEIEQMLVDNQIIQLIEDKQEPSNPNDVRTKHWLSLSGSTEYQTCSVIKLKWKLDLDNRYEFYSERIINHLRVDVTTSPNVEALFVPIGLEIFDLNVYPPNRYVRNYSKTLLPEKGFRLIFVRK